MANELLAYLTRRLFTDLWDTMTEEMPLLPTFLDRRTWSDKKQAASKAAWDKALDTQRREEEQRRRESAKLAAQRKADALLKESQKAQRKADKAARAQRNELRARAIQAAINIALEKGSVTAISLRKTLPADLQSVSPKWALRRAVKQGSLKRVSLKVYQAT